MGLLDYENELGDAQEVLATAASTNVIDLQSYPSFGAKETLAMIATINTAYSGGTSVKATLQTDDNAAFSSATTVADGNTIAVASLTAGATLFQVLLNGLTLERYVRLNYTVVGTPTAGKIDARLEVSPKSDEITLS